jgi:2-iminoacetate synthase
MSANFRSLLDATPFSHWCEFSRNCDRSDVERALAGSTRGLAAFAALISPCAGERLEALAQRAHALTVQRFGRTMQMYAPLYLSNECVDTCTYCGFSHGSSIHRLTLDLPAAMREAMHLHGQGFRHLLLLTGEHPRLVSTGYLAEHVRALRPHFASIAVEVAPQTVDGYRELVAAGVDALVVYQETYDRDAYASVHLAGRKRNFDWRLATAERGAAAGIKRLGIGALLGLADPLRDALATYLHADWCQRHLWRCSLSVSVPRLQRAADAIDAPCLVSDAFLARYVCALRLALPDVGIVLSTREPAPLRDGLLRLGVTQMSAGSHTEPGGYAQPDAQAEQFEVADRRSAAEVAARLRDFGYEVVWKDWEASLCGAA